LPQRFVTIPAERSARPRDVGVERLLSKVARFGRVGKFCIGR
jgi:hypothetical protein